ncbi:hypothetical protein [Capillimicrobium parvum]|uniref:Uncharacterized protein n=1 Tax=Capillimicrobium parvum TaxID=2884022 RepID=A0A9E6XXN6_9ACTN|nr:hypothetical protein [Capillimicrobium parvum]UGS36130.1 hypothetical protein DSM104329_02530 [Capillimicrobium parvum]
MTNALMIGLALALAAAVALNAGYLLQHAGARTAPPISARHPVTMIRGLLGSRAWLAGLALGLTGWALHVAALAHAPLSLVQAFAAGGLVLSIPAAAVLLRERLGRAELQGIAIMVGALLLLAVGVGPIAAPTLRPGALAAYLLAAAALAAALAAAPASDRRPHMLGLAGGVLYGAADAATKAATIVGGHGVGALLLSPWPLVVLLASAGAFLCFQRGLQTGAAVPVVALMTAGTNVVAMAAGVFVFGDPLGAGPVAAGLHVLAFSLVALAAWRLAPAQTAFA